MPDPRDTSPQAVQACHDLITWMIPQLDKLPRSRRFTLGERIETGLLEILEHLIAAAYGRGAAKREALQRANLRLDVVRHLWRVGYALKNIAHKQYTHGAGRLERLGKQIGGWRRSNEPQE